MSKKEYMPVAIDLVIRNNSGNAYTYIVDVADIVITQA